MNLSKIVLFVEGGNVLEGDIDCGISVRGLIWVLAGLSSRLCLSLKKLTELQDTMDGCRIFVYLYV